MTTDWFTEKTASTWPELYHHLETYLNEAPAPWVFRGQKRKDWELKTGIERLRERFDVDCSELPTYELKLVREFFRRAHIYHPSPPDEDDHLEWLALLRHHGGPTRLLDFTYSPFIATYFALQEADEDSAVWAIDAKWLKGVAENLVTKSTKDNKIFDNFSVNRDGASFEKMFRSNPPIRFVRSMNPMRLNERLTLQQGVFLCPGDIRAPFEKNLRAATELKKITATTLKENVHKIVISKTCRTDALARLRKMNIDSTTLFPGLDGFAQSLNTRFVEIGEMPIAAEDDTT